MKNFIKKLIPFALSLTVLNTTTVLASDLSTWAENNYKTSNSYGIITDNVITKNLQENITKEEFLELVMNTYQVITDEGLIIPTKNMFYDTNNLAVNQAYCYGIIAGDYSGMFYPEKSLTKEELAKIIFDMIISSENEFYISEKLSIFDDVYLISDWAITPIQTLIDYGILSIENNSIHPKDYVSREFAINVLGSVCNVFAKTDKIYEIGVSLEETENTLKIDWFDYNYSGNYSVIIKNEKGEIIFKEDIKDFSLEIEKEIFRTKGTYSIIVGITTKGLKSFSVPIDYVSNIDYTPNKNQAIIECAKQYLGTPYIWGGTSPTGFDCSGFVQYVYGQNGYTLTRTTYTQWDSDGTYVSKEDLVPGDLVYFGKNGSPTHVGLYIGDGNMIHSPQTGDVVKYTSIDSDYYASRFLGGKRIIA